ncbi:AAA family ATPase [Aeromonas piscicola]
MLNKLSLKNFKSFKKMTDLEIKPITIIVGKNSCGKSSIIQSLLLLKQTLESPLPVNLCLDGRFIKCSSLKELAYRLPPINQASIGYELHFNDRSLSLTFSNKKENDSYVPKLVSRTIKTHDGISENIHKLTNKKLTEILNDLKFPHKIKKIIKKEIQYNKFTPELVNFEYYVDGENEKTHSSSVPVFLITDLDRYSRHINDEIQKFKYLSPVRAMPERAYLHYSPQVDELLSDGSNAAHLLWSKKDEKVLWKNETLKLSVAVNKCIECLGLSQKMTPSKIGDVLYTIGVSENLSGDNVSLSDVGFGYSQILPVILMGLVNQKDDCLILLEQPEIHLHPSSAANLADLFLGFIESGSHYIIETHSQELINKLRLRVIENPELKEKINIVFVDYNNIDGASIRQFEIDENGMFPDWPEGFLDESEKISDSIIKARINKRNERREAASVDKTDNKGHIKTFESRMPSKKTEGEQ